MTLEEILQDIHGLDARLRELESQYGVLSADIHALYRLGELNKAVISSAGWVITISARTDYAERNSPARTIAHPAQTDYGLPYHCDLI
ncbi:MAG: hypothetical protein KIS63_04920 [Caldilineales bacterium]|nr:hypothetical protein [Caldilineales bacterium]